MHWCALAKHLLNHTAVTVSTGSKRHIYTSGVSSAMVDQSVQHCPGVPRSIAGMTLLTSVRRASLAAARRRAAILSSFLHSAVREQGSIRRKLSVCYLALGFDRYLLYERDPKDCGQVPAAALRFLCRRSPSRRQMWTTRQTGVLLPSTQ